MGEIAPLFSVLFFIMMLALGFGSEFSIMESLMSIEDALCFIDVLGRPSNTGKRGIRVFYSNFYQETICNYKS